MSASHPSSPAGGTPGLQCIALSDVAATPWKNGGGITRDLLCWPSASDWQLRISAAEVTQSGPFSSYPGIARWFCVLQGAGVVLHVEGRPQRLTPDSAPLHFDGAAAPACDLIAGATLDLNLMARQDAGRAEMARAVAGVPWQSSAPLRAVFSQQASVLHVQGQAPLPLPARTLAFTSQARGEAWQLAGRHSAAWWMAFEPHAR